MNVKQAIFYLSFITSIWRFVAEVQTDHVKIHLTVITLHLIDRVQAQFFEHLNFTHYPDTGSICRQYLSTILTGFG